MTIAKPFQLTLPPVRCLLLCIFVATYLLGSAGSCEAGDWGEVRGDHFIVRYQDAAGRGFADEVMTRAEWYYDQINADLGFDRAIKSENLAFWLWDDRCKILLYRDKQTYLAETGLPVWSAGAVNSTQRLLYSYSNSDAFLSSVLPHELAHVFFRELVGFDNPEVPRWLDEGVAQYAEDGQRKGSVERMRAWVAAGNYLPFGLFHRMTTRGLAPEEARLFYAQAASVVHFFIAAYGSGRFVELLKGLREEYPFERALSFATSSRIDSLELLEKEWLGFYREAPQGLGEIGTRATDEMLKAGDPVPPLRLEHLDGREFDLARDQTQNPESAYLILFWSLSCEASPGSLRSAQWLHETYAAEGLRVLTIPMDGEERMHAYRSLAEIGYSLPILIGRFSEEGILEAAQRFGVSGTPTTYLVGADGRVRLAEFGPLSNPLIRDAVVKALAGD